MSTTLIQALVLSFHGWTGCGKNHVSNLIAQSLYKKGMHSSFVHLYLSTLHFPYQDNDHAADYAVSFIALSYISILINLIFFELKWNDGIYVRECSLLIREFMFNHRL